MKEKKSDKANLENFTTVFMLLGLVLALFVTQRTLDYTSPPPEVVVLEDDKKKFDDEEEIPEVIMEQPDVPPPPPPPPTPEVLEIVEDEVEVEETIVETTEVEETEAVEVQEIIEEPAEEEEIIDDVPFAMIEEVPVFPGCKGSTEKKKKCFEDKVRKHVTRKFNTELANELGLDSGRKKIICVFKVGKDGNIVDVNARAPHPKLKAEALKVIKSLPKMTPGRQGGRNVRVPYMVPITLEVE